MCGIFAAFSVDGRGLPADAEARARRALDAIRHRGPDASGIHLDPRNRFVLGHVRLSVIDPGALSDQPFWSECGRRFVIFNGEIYNYVELREELTRAGVTFRTRSDTEVLLQAIAHWGPSCINRFNGMWAFVWGDTETGSVIVSRDRWGVKPLYVHRSGGTVVLCSEAKGIFGYTGSVPEADQGSIGMYLRLGVGGESARTWFRGVERFPCASHQRIALDADRASMGPTERYWDYPAARDRGDGRELREEFAALVGDAVRIRLRSDVPLGLSLSGGIDSAAIAWTCGERFGQRLQAFTAWHQPEAQSELPRARMIAARFGHQLSPVAESVGPAMIDDLRTAIWHLDSGHSSTAIVPYLNLCRAARTGLTVMLEGQGADELLAGYYEFQLFAAADALVSGRFGDIAPGLRTYVQSVGWSGLLSDIVRFSVPGIYLRQGSRWGSHRLLSAEAQDSVPEDVRRLRASGGNLDSALLYWHRRNLTNLLQYGDAVSMSVNLETRCPFLDYRLVELGFRMRHDLLVRGGFGKVVLRDLADGSVPDEICWRRRKDGFTNPTATEVCSLVRRSGLPEAGLDWAVGSGLLTAAARDPARIDALPENIKYRLMSTVLWAEMFQLASGRPS